MMRSRMTVDVARTIPATPSPVRQTDFLPLTKENAVFKRDHAAEESVAELPESYGNVGIGRSVKEESQQLSRAKGAAGKRPRERMATTVAKRTRRDSTEDSDASETESEDLGDEPAGRPLREGSIELGEASVETPIETTNPTTSESSIFDLPESPSSSRSPEMEPKRKRKRQTTTPDAGSRGRRSNKRTKVAGTSDLDGENIVPQTPSQRPLSKITFASAQRSHLHSPELENSKSPGDTPRVVVSEESVQLPDAQEAESDGNDLRCRICDRIFSGYGHLRRHKQSHYNRRNEGNATGNFTQEEMDALEEYREQACEDFHLSQYEFNELINWPKSLPWPRHDVSKDVLMASYYDVLPRRNKKSLRRYKERWFKNTSAKAHKWSAAQDRELKALVREHGQKWVEIANLIGRTQDEVATHWFNKVQHQEKQKEGQWSAEEVRNLRDAIKLCKTRMGVSLGPETDHEIKWSVISDMLDNTRSRQQCSLRWRRERMKQTRAHEIKQSRKARKAKSRMRGLERLGEDLDAVESSELDDASNEIQQQPPSTKLSRTHSLGSRRNTKVKSSEYVHESDSSDGTTNLGSHRAANAEAGGGRELERDDNMQIIDAADQETEGVTSVDIDSPRNDMGLTPLPTEVAGEMDLAEATPTSRHTADTGPSDDSPESWSRSKNPFHVTSKTPLKNLSQLFKATQGNSSGIKGKRAILTAGDTPSNPPNRPSPQIAMKSPSNVIAGNAFSYQNDDDLDSDSTSVSELEMEARTGNTDANRQDRPNMSAEPEAEDSDDAESEAAVDPPTFSSRVSQSSSDEEEVDEASNAAYDESQDAQQRNSGFEIYDDNLEANNMKRASQNDVQDSDTEESTDLKVTMTNEEDEEVEDVKPKLFSSKISESSNDDDSSDGDIDDDVKPDITSSESEAEASSSEDNTSVSDDDSEVEDSKETGGLGHLSWLQNLGNMAHKVRMSQLQSRPSTQGQDSVSTSQTWSGVERYVTADGIRKVEEDSDAE